MFFQVKIVIDLPMVQLTNKLKLNKIVQAENMRHALFHNLSWLPNYCVLDLKLLTSGNPTLSNEQNEIIIKRVFEYIKRSE